MGTSTPVEPVKKEDDSEVNPAEDQSSAENKEQTSAVDPAEETKSADNTIAENKEGLQKSYDQIDVFIRAEAENKRYLVKDHLLE